MKIIKINQNSDLLNVSYTGDTMTVERAFQCGLIPASVYVKILERQKVMRTLDYLSLCESEEEFKLSEVHGLILRCLNKNESLESRKIKPLMSEGKGLGDQGSILGCDDCPEDLHNNHKLSVDVAVQCDLMSSSSTLIVLGHHQQFMGLVVPLSREIMSSSFQCELQIGTSDFTSKLFSNRGKIAAFYIPESSEIIDINSAVENGLTERCTADFLTSVEIPDTLPDVDHLHEMYSSWLMYKMLLVDGWHDSAAVSDLTSPSSSEAEQVFVSYLMMNSYIDPRSGQRILILDTSSQTFLQTFTHFNLNSSCNTEQADVQVLLINEETEEISENTQDYVDPCYFISKINGTIIPDENIPHECELNNLACLDNSSETFEEQSVTDVQVLKQDFQYELLKADNGIQPETKIETAVHFKLDETEEMNNLWYDLGEADSNSLDDQASLQTPAPHITCFAKSKNADSPFDNKSGIKFHHETLPTCNAESHCRESTSVDINQSYVSCSSDKNEPEDNYYLQVHTDEMEEEGNFSVPLGSLKNPEAVQTVPELNNLLSDEEISASGLNEDTWLSLKQTGIYQTEQDNSLIADCNISFRKPLTFGLGETEPVALEIKACSFSDENVSSSPFEGHTVSLTQTFGAENIQMPKKRGVAAMVLNLPSEEDSKDTEDADKEGNAVTMSNYTHCGHEPEMISPSTLIHVFHTDTQSLMASDKDSQVSFERQLTGGSDVNSIVKENTASIKELSSTSDISADSESQLQHASIGFCSDKSESQPADELFGAGNDDQKGYRVSESELGSSASLLADFCLETKGDTDSAGLDLHSQPVQSLHYSPSWNLVESALVSPSEDDGISEIKHVEDGSRCASPQEAALLLKDDFNAECQPLCGPISQRERASLCDRLAKQSNTSPQTSVFASDTNTKNTSVHRGNVEDPSLTIKDIPEPNSSGGDEFNAEVQKERLSPVKQLDGAFMVTNDAAEISISKLDNVNVSCSNQACDTSNFQLREPEKEELGSDTKEERTAWVANDGITSSICCSSQSNFYKAVKVLVDEQGDIKQTEDHLKPIENNVFQGVSKNSTPDLVNDMSQHTLSSNSNTRNSEQTCEEDEASELKEQDNPLNIQLQLLQLFKTVSLSQDFSVLQEMVESLSSALGSDTQKEWLRTLESIKEESSEGEEEESIKEGSGFRDPAKGTHRPSDQGCDGLDVYKAEGVKTEVEFVFCLATFLVLLQSFTYYIANICDTPTQINAYL